MFVRPSSRNQRVSAFSLVEMLLVIAVIGVISAIAIPTVSRINESADDAKARVNARNVQSLSEALAAFGVAHVIPDSMGGAEATTRLLREGVVLTEGPMAGTSFVLPGVSDEEVEKIGKYLQVRYDRKELRLIFHDPEEDGNTSVPMPGYRQMICDNLPRVVSGFYASVLLTFR